MFRSIEMVKLFCLFHKDDRDDVLSGLQALGRVEFFDVRQRFPYLDKPKTSVRDVARRLERVKRLLVAMPPTRRETLEEKLLGPRMRPVQLLSKKTYDFLMESRVRLDELEKEFEGLTPEDLEDFRRTHRVELLVLEEELENALERMRALEKFGATKDTLVLGCWVTMEDVLRVRRTLRRVTDDACALSFEVPSKGENVPVVLDNPGFLKPYELLSEAYGVPRYREIDPTPILAFTFTLFFGIMFADVGYGLVLVGLGLAVFLKTRVSNMVQRNLNLIIIYSGLASIFFGFLFGEFFGGTLHLGPHFIGHDMAETMELLMILAISVGIVHISISVISRLASARLADESLLYPASILAILWPTVALAFSRWEALPPWATSLAKYLLAAGLLSLVKVKGIEAFDEIIALFANIVSYSRIAIISVLHVVVARLLLESVSGLPRTPTGTIVGAVAFASGTVLILAMGVFITFIHSLRLHWLEFFKRFYTGMGETFKPFTRKSEYTYIQ